MLIIALVLAVVSLAALVTAVVTSNELIAWVCIGLSALGVLLLIVDAIRDRHHRAAAPPAAPADLTQVIAPVGTTEQAETIGSVEPAEVIETVGSGTGANAADEYPDVHDAAAETADYPDFDELAVLEDHPDEVVFDEPDYDTPSDDEPVYPVPAEEAAIHTVSETELLSEPYAEAADAPYTADSTTVIYSSESYSGESSDSDESPAVTESYVVIDSDGSDALADADDSHTVTYADEIDDESGSSGERRESDGER